MKPKRSTKQKKNIKRIGSRKVKERKANYWMEDAIQEALHQVEISASRDKKNKKCHQRIWCQ